MKTSEDTVKIEVAQDSFRAASEQLKKSGDELTKAMSRAGIAIPAITLPMTAFGILAVRRAAEYDREQAERELMRRRYKADLPLPPGVEVNVLSTRIDIGKLHRLTGDFTYTDARDLDLEERWQYQKWVFAAPLRWWWKLRWWVEGKGL